MPEPIGHTKSLRTDELAVGDVEVGLGRIWSRVQTFVSSISKFLAGIAGISAAGLMVHVALDVSSRNILNTPIPGTLETVTYVWMPTIVFLALPYALQQNEHLRMTLMVDGITQQMKSVAWTVSMLSVLFLSALLAVFLWSEAFSAYGIGEADTSSSVVVPIWPIKFIAAIGVTQLVIQACAMAGPKSAN